MYMTEEINLIEVFKGTGSKFRRRWKKISLIILICLLLAVGLKFIWPERYDNHLIGQAKSLRIEVLAEVIKSLDEIIHEKNYSHLARILGIDETNARSIRKLELKEVYPEIFTHTTSENYFRLTVTFNMKVDYMEMQDAFIAYLENNPFLKLRKDKNLEANKKTLLIIGQEIDHLEVLRNKLLSESVKEPSSYIIMNPTEINSKIVDLHQKKNKLEVVIELSDQIQIIRGFTELNNPTSPKLSNFLLGGFILGLFVSVLYALYGVKTL